MSPVLLAALLAALGQGPAADVPEDDGIECVYSRAQPEDALILYAMDRRAEPENAREDEAMNRIADAVAGCVEQHGWSDPKAVAALQYTIGRAAYDDAAATLSGRGFAPDFLEQVIADLGEEGLEMLRTGDDRPENMAFVGTVLARKLEEARVYIADREDFLNIGRIVARGIAASSVRDRGAVLFRTR